MVARDLDWLREELERWARDLPGCEVVSGPPWCFVRREGLEVSLEAGDEIRVRIGPWALALDVDDEDVPGEAADLVAAALFGRMRGELVRVGDRWTRFRLEFAVGERWVDVALLRRMPFSVWKRPVRSVMQNELRPPDGVALRKAGALPYAPWVGVLATEEDAGGAREMPVDGEIDLHPFKPKEVAGVVRAYIDACLEKGIYELRVVHGKGIGNLRRTVHALLDKHPQVEGYKLGGSGGGSWGATVVDLKRP